MKRSYLLPLGVLATLLVFSIWSGSTIQTHTDHWRDQLRQADALAQAEDWPAATATLVESYQDWQIRQTRLHILFKHDAVDNAETMYCRSIAFSLAREPGEFRAELANLDAQLALLAETERLSLENIF